jgi:hypothetical protein
MRRLPSVPNLLSLSAVVWLYTPSAVCTAAAEDAWSIKEAAALRHVLGGLRKSGGWGRLRASWVGGTDDACDGWMGIGCTEGRVTSLSLEYMSLEGALAPEIGQLQELRMLKLIGNRISSTLPATIGQLTSLHTLNLKGNKITDPFPTELADCLSLKMLNVQGCLLTGTVPTAVYSLVNLESLTLGKNALTGNISPEICRLTKLRTLNFAINDISGQIPACIGESMPELVHVDLRNNRIDGRCAPQSVMCISAVY